MSLGNFLSLQERKEVSGICTNMENILYESLDIAMDIKGRVSLGEKISRDCIIPSELENDTVITWKKDDKFYQNGNNLIIPKFESNSFGRYSCEISKAGESSTRILDLNPKWHSGSDISNELLFAALR